MPSHTIPSGLLFKILHWVNTSEISTIKSVVASIVEVINDPNSNARDLKNIVEIDPPLTARVLKMANSAYYSPRCPIGDILQAVIFIGFDALKELVVSQKVCLLFKNTEIFEGYSRTSLWKHSIAVALLAKMICRREFGDKGQVAYVAGLLHEIGIIIEEQMLQSEFHSTLSFSREKRINLFQAEQKLLGINHAAIGKAVVEDWSLPPALAAVIGYHHHPESAPLDHRDLIAIVYVADTICQRNQIGYSDAPHTELGTFNRCLRHLNITQDSLDLILPDVINSVDEMERQGLF
ncbi:MAG: HDOD domain-containing protein [Pseudomonadota bacterium]